MLGDTDLQVALEAVSRANGRLPVMKVNCVVQRGRNEDELWVVPSEGAFTVAYLCDYGAS